MRNQMEFVTTFLIALAAMPQCGHSSEEPPGKLSAESHAEAPLVPQGGDDAPVECTSKHFEPDDDAPLHVDLAGAPVRGAEGAPVTIVVFSDFECPYCAKLDATLRELSKRTAVKIAFRHAPLPSHASARLAARAALVAQEQGRFWEFHDAVFARQELGRAALVDAAASVGLRRFEFERDLDAKRIEARLRDDEAQARELGVRGTPTLFVNGRRVVGARSVDDLEALVKKATAD